MAADAHSYLMRQFDTAWTLTSYHIESLTTAECLWRPAKKGLHVQQSPDGTWRADWPEHEGYDLGPPSLAWLTWHVGFWWSMALNQCFGDGRLAREQVHWPGSADEVRTSFGALRTRWLEVVGPLTEAELQSTRRTRWPFQDRPLGDLMAWVNIELMKNAAEIGYVRFLHAVRSG